MACSQRRIFCFGESPAIAFIMTALIVSLSTAFGMLVQKSVDRTGAHSGHGFAAYIAVVFVMVVGIHFVLFKVFHYGGGMLAGNNLIVDTSCQACWDCKESPYTCGFWCLGCTTCDTGCCRWFRNTLYVSPTERGIRDVEMGGDSTIQQILNPTGTTTLTEHY